MDNKAALSLVDSKAAFSAVESTAALSMVDSKAAFLLVESKAALSLVDSKAAVMADESDGSDSTAILIWIVPVSCIEKNELSLLYK